MSKCEHGLTTAECFTCASPKHGAPPDPAQPEPADEFVKTMGGQFALVIAEIWHAHPDYGIRQTLDELNRRFPAPQPISSLDEFLALAEKHGIKTIHDLPGLIPALQATEPAQPDPTTDAAVSDLAHELWAIAQSPAPIDDVVALMRDELHKFARAIRKKP